METPAPEAETEKTVEVPKPQRSVRGEFRCDLCSFTTAIRAQYALHLHLHGSSKMINTDKRKRHKCGFCPYSTFSFSLLNEHKKKHHKSRRVRRGKAKAKAQAAAAENPIGGPTDHIINDQNALKKWVVKKYQEFRMEETNKDSNGISMMEVEANNNRPKAPGIEAEQEKTQAVKVLKVYSCRVCDEDFTDKSELIAHEKSHDADTQ